MKFLWLLCKKQAEIMEEKPQETAMRQQLKIFRANFDTTFIWITVGYIMVFEVKFKIIG